MVNFFFFFFGFPANNTYDGHFAPQEVTPNIYEIFQQSSWWREYNCSISKQMAFSTRYFCMQVHEKCTYMKSRRNICGVLSILIRRIKLDESLMMLEGMSVCICY